MSLPTITREEFDARLAQSTEQMRQKRLALEAQAAELEELIGKYSAVLERLEARHEEAEQEADKDLARRDRLRMLLTELAERTSAVAASL
jgi:chromosome segregation ATPase